MLLFVCPKTLENGGQNYWKLEKTWENYGNGKHLENRGKHDVERINWTHLVISRSSSRQKIESLTACIEENQLKSTCTVGRFQQRLQILGQMMPVANLDEPTMNLRWIPIEALKRPKDAIEMYQLGNLMTWRCCGVALQFLKARFQKIRWCGTPTNIH